MSHDCHICINITNAQSLLYAWIDQLLVKAEALDPQGASTCTVCPGRGAEVKCPPTNQLQYFHSHLLRIIWVEN